MRSNSCRYWTTQIYLASRISTQKDPFPRSEYTAALNFDMLDAGRPPNADSPPKDQFWSPWWTLKRKRKKVVSENEKPEHPLRSVRKLMNTLSTTHARMAVWKLKTWRRQRLDDWMFARGCSQASAHKSTLRVLIYCAGQVRGGGGGGTTTRALVAVEPRRPPVTNVGTETAFRHLQCKHCQKSKHLLRSEVSWCDQTSIDLHLRRSTCSASWFSTQNEPLPRSEFTPALYLDILDADRLPNAADSPRSSRNRLITTVKLKKIC